jgi:hypothetical protein
MKLGGPGGRPLFAETLAFVVEAILLAPPARLYRLLSREMRLRWGG